MLKSTLSNFTAALLALGLIGSAAHAQPARVFVAAQGSDANPCSFAQPCRTFQHAHDTVAAKGEIDVLDPAGYGAVVISKAISIQGHGFAGLAVTSGDGITINANASDVVNLRGLLLDGVGAGAAGITFNTGAFLDIQDCLIRNFTNIGINFIPSGASKLSVSSTLASFNVPYGILVHPSGSGTAIAVFDHVAVNNNTTYGIYVRSGTGEAHASLTDSVVAHNGTIGIAVSSTGGATNVMIRGTTISNNNTGLSVAFATSTARISRSTITQSAFGWTTLSGGTILSYGDNNVDGNTTDGTPTSTIALK